MMSITHAAEGALLAVKGADLKGMCLHLIDSKAILI
jgi:hypothetical protein